jgi:regulator of nucleoside diphosphate kinase
MKITVNDYQRLMGFVQLASCKTKMPGVTNKLIARLDAAKLFQQNEIAKNVITMREAEITVTYPQDADARARRVSVFSEIGLALLGQKENDIVSRRIPSGTGRFQVEKVIYQPEASGDYFL